MIPSAWSISGKTLEIDRGVIVGVLNVTPDSFSDGGDYLDPEAAIERGIEMCDQGAAVIDVGGESTRPGASPVVEEEELRRLMPVVEGLVAKGVLLSVDTSKPGVARQVLEAGAVAINDVTGLTDPEMIDVVAQSDCGVVVMHMQGTPADMHIDPAYDDVVSEVEAFLLGQVEHLERAGVSRERVVIDPGIGFGKRPRHSLALLSGLGRLSSHDVPVMIGTSRKGFLAKLVGDDSLRARDRATAVTTALGFASGARLFRVHEVAESRDALRVAGAIVAHQQWDEWLQG